MNSEDKNRLIASARKDIAQHLVAVQSYELSCNPTGKTRWASVRPGSLENARVEYDAGYVDFVQQRIGDGEYLLYAIPRKSRANVPGYLTFREIDAERAVA